VRQPPAHHAFVFAGQQVAVAQHGAAHGEDGDVLAGVQRCAQAALLAQFIGQHKLRADAGSRRFGRWNFGVQCQHNRN
jgi:hypothetical protein